MVRGRLGDGWVDSTHRVGEIKVMSLTPGDDTEKFATVI